ncbi:MAG: peptidase dimerization domain-containing protein [Deltaproteobacteria bacterium]|nr:peptidase dimerization domain-containing protein [Deltaproteobacteria bacterium]
MTTIPQTWPNARDEVTTAEASAVALALELAAVTGDPASCLQILAAFASASGLHVTRHKGGGRAVLLLRRRGLSTTSKGIGLCATLSSTPAAEDRPLSGLLPGGAWSAALAVATVAGARATGDVRLTAMIEAPSDAGTDEVPAEVTSYLAEQHLLIGGDGGAPYSEAGRIFVPLTSARRSAAWLEVTATIGDGWPNDLSTGHGGAAESLLAALAQIPELPGPIGPIWQAAVEAFRQGADAELNAWIDEMAGADCARCDEILAAVAPLEQAYTMALRRPTVTISRLDAGERPDRAAKKARAILDLRAPADRGTEELVALVRQAMPEEVNVRTIASRPGRAVYPEHPVFAAVARTLRSAHTPFVVLPNQARREPMGLHWEQLAVPVVGFAPAWTGLHVHVVEGLLRGEVPVEEAGLVWGAALYVRVAFDLAGIDTGTAAG